MDCAVDGVRMNTDYKRLPHEMWVRRLNCPRNERTGAQVQLHRVNLVIDCGMHGTSVSSSSASECVARVLISALIHLVEDTFHAPNTFTRRLASRLDAHGVEHMMNDSLRLQSLISSPAGSAVCYSYPIDWILQVIQGMRSSSLAGQ